MSNAHSPEELDALLERAMADGDAESLIALYEDDAAFASAGIVRMRGAEQLRAGLGELAAQRLQITGQPRVIAAFGDLAVMYNDWAETGVDESGTPFRRSGKAIEVVRRQADGTWKFLFDDPYGRG